MALIGTVTTGFALVFDQLRTAFRTTVDKLKRTAVRRSRREVHAGNLRNDLASLLDIHTVSDPDVEQGDLFGIMQRGPLDDRSGQQHRFEIGHRRDGSGPADLKIHGHQPRERPFRLELVGHGPAGRLGRKSQTGTQGEIVYLDDDAVRSEGQLLAGRVPVTDKSVDFLHIATQSHCV